MLFGFDFSLVAMIGVILLIGIVKKNGIMMVDFAITAERDEHLSATQAVRKALAGKANVHRAPANCGPTASGIKNIDAWLASAPGVERWDVIHFNFGIHDRATPVADYTGRLEKIVERLEKTGAKLVWATTTPIPDVPAQNQTAASIVERNAAAATVMEKHGVAIDDLFAFITPHLGEAQLPNDVHFKPEGYDLLGGKVAESIRAAVDLTARPAPPDRDPR
jgi:acyl-CoA thioesterase-1